MLREQVREAVRAGGLFARDRPLLAMLSGGRDSTCLLDVAVALLGAAAVSALHVNYGLRDQSDADERHCAALCEQLGVELEIVRTERSSTQRPLSAHTEEAHVAEQPTRAPRSGNLQAWARELRYAEATRIAEARDALIATGHTQSDQLETILYRLAASPGRRALLGMAASDGRLIRPLLGVTREQTAAYCEARGLAWREDESNDDERYARARVRKWLVPALCAVHPAAEANVLRTASLLREETELLDGLVDAELAGRGEIAIARLRELPAALARMVVVRLAEAATGAYVPQAGDRVGEILALGARGGRAELHVGGQAGAVIEGGRLTMVELPPRA
ncbi:MAG TPA: tRNA lysidine(34) synthetase TilS [Solirubrobacteraceae bacterium]|jgi:tRNA(Ile)-lysidine synthase|nr:tRNA lysidine(34) synthetase TilS [Solirubrobacteraceae bacterium]